MSEIAAVCGGKSAVTPLTLLVRVADNNPIPPATTGGTGFFFGEFMGVNNWEHVQAQAWIKKVNKAYRTQRFTKSTATWRRLCLDRDKHQCVLCGSKKNIEVHHIERWYDAPLKRLKVKNGATLCRSCHHKHHNHVGHDFPNEVTKTIRLKVAGRMESAEINKKTVVLFKMNRCITMPELGD